MSLKIVSASEPIVIDSIVTCITGGPGLGKTTLGFSAEAPLLLDADTGVHRAGRRGDSVPVKAWSDVSEMTAADLKNYKTLVVDTAGRMLDVLSLQLIEEDPKNGKRDGGLSLPGFGVLKARFASWLKMVRSFGLDVVLIAHSTEEKDGDKLIERLDMQGQSKGEVYKSADLMGRLAMGPGNKRMLNFNPGETSFGKNPAQIGPFEVPHYTDDPKFLAKIIASTKEGINKMSTEQQAFAGVLEEWKAKLDDAGSPEDFGAIMEEMKKAPAQYHANLKRLLAKAAKGEGLVYSQASGKFEKAKKEEAKSAAGGRSR